MEHRAEEKMAVHQVKRRKHLFTSKKKSFRALLSDCLGAVSFVFSLITLYKTFMNEGQATLNYGAAFMACVIIALAGFVMAVLSRKEPDCYYSFSYIGMILTGSVLVLSAVVIYLGAV